MPVLADKARQFHALHEAGRPLLLPNAWDVASARVIADAGAAAIATTSAGVAWSLGFGDGGHLDRQRALQVIARIAAAVEVPVTADIEGGFADEPVPVNVLIGPGTLPVPALAKAGAARISAGSSIAEAAYGLAARAARELLADGTAQALAGAWTTPHSTR